MATTASTGFEGNDTIHGGNGDDVLFGGNGDDVHQGRRRQRRHGAADRASAPTSLIGGDGNDFLLGGDDGVEHFGGRATTSSSTAATRTEGAFGGVGDDWIEGGDGHDGGLFGDEGNVFDLLAGLSQIGGDDVIDGGPGQDGHFGEGGDDIFLMSEGSNKFFGDYGFDWITQRGWPFAGRHRTGPAGAAERAAELQRPPEQATGSLTARRAGPSTTTFAGPNKRAVRSGGG